MLEDAGNKILWYLLFVSYKWDGLFTFLFVFSTDCE